MLLNYFKIALRNILKYKLYSSINVFGLAIGMACSMFIMLYIADEISYDRFLDDSDNIYRVGFGGRLQGNDFKFAVSSAPIAEALLSEVPEVESATRFGLRRNVPMHYKDNVFTEGRILVADSNFFNFFSFPLLSGNLETVLDGTNRLVITESTAKRYFGSDNPIGKIILRGDEEIASVITGIAKDPPANSHIQFDMILSGESWEYMRDNHWTNTSLYTYIKVLPNTDISKVSGKLDDLTERNIGVELERIIGLSMEQFKEKGNAFGFFFQPMLDIHLRSDLSSEITPNGNIQYLYIFGSIAIFILLIACINFMNLSTARSSTRAKEIGVRKSVGAARGRLIFQFLSESMLYSYISTFVALLIIGIFLEPFNTLSGKNLDISLFIQPLSIVIILCFGFLVGLIAGSYPAFYLTSFKPMDVLKSKVSFGPKNSGLRNSLVVFQFMISIVLILGSLVVNKQLKYMQEKNMGFDKENVIDLNNSLSLGSNASAFKNELLQNPEFVGASFANALPPNITSSNAFRKGGSEHDFLLHVCFVDFDHLSVMGYSMTEGRFFSRDFLSDTTAIILNETAYRQMEFDGVNGQTIINYNSDKPVPLRLVGVINDFNFENLRTEIKPMAILLGGQPNDVMAIRISSGKTSEAINKLEYLWNKYSTKAFEFSFVDQNIDALFRSEQRMGKVVFIFTMLIIIIACLGLFGLATYLGEQRCKEIGIRKVMGASATQIALLLFQNFILLIGISFLIAAPLGWYLTTNWLQGFSYRVSIDSWIFVLAGLSSLIIAMLTIGFQAYKVARENPLKALKSE